MPDRSTHETIAPAPPLDCGCSLQTMCATHAAARREAAAPGRGIFARSDIEIAAEGFVQEALSALGLIWEPDEIAAEVAALTDRAFGWRDDQ